MNEPSNIIQLGTKELLALIIAAVGGPVIVIVAVARAFKSQVVDPVIQNVVAAWYASEAQITARKNAQTMLILAWYGETAQSKARENEILATLTSHERLEDTKKQRAVEVLSVVSTDQDRSERREARSREIEGVVSNAVMRRDGVVSKEIDNRIEITLRGVYAQFEELKGLMRQAIENQQSKDLRLARIEGALKHANGEGNEGEEH